MSDDLTIRPFRPADQAATRRLVLSGLGDHFGQIDETINPDLDDIESHYLRNGHHFIVAVRKEDVIGAGALIEERPGVGRLVRMSVDRDQRGHGIGRKLVNHLLDEARHRGYQQVLIETNDDWRDAIGLYNSCGFTEFDHHHGDVHMSIDL